MRTNVGLLTGDTSINGDAPVVVMTTEVLRNMLYADSDYPRSTWASWSWTRSTTWPTASAGAVWEEVIIHLPSEVQVASLSATVSNAEEFGAWLDTVRGDTDVIVSEHRPVPLWQHVMVGKDIRGPFRRARPPSTKSPPQATLRRRLALPAGAVTRRRRSARFRGQS